MRLRCVLPRLAGALLAGAVCGPAPAESAGCFVAPAGGTVRLPALQVFLDWDPAKEQESLVLQPDFEGNSASFGLIVATPTRPTVAAVPRDFFRDLAAFTQLKRRVFPESRLLPLDDPRQPAGLRPADRRPDRVRLLDAGLARGLDVRTFPAAQRADLDAWLKENGFVLPGAALDAYAGKAWFFTIARLDPQQLQKDRDGLFHGGVVPFRLTFAAKAPVLPLRLARASAAERLDLTLYVHAPGKMDLPGDLSYQYQWLALLGNAAAELPKGAVPGKGDEWLKAVQLPAAMLAQRGRELGYTFARNQRPLPNKQGRSVASLEWAGRITAADVQALKGEAPLSESVPDPDEGFSEADVRNSQRSEAIHRVIRQRLEKFRKDRPAGYLVRGLAPEEVKGVRELAEALRQGWFLTKIRKTWARAELASDPVLMPAHVGDALDSSEYEELLPGSP